MAEQLLPAMAHEPGHDAHDSSPPPWLYKVLYVCFFLSGAAGLIYQVCWVKALGLVFGHTTYAITAVLCAFMAGLALGSWLLGRYAERARRPLQLYGWIELGIALASLASLAAIWFIRLGYPPMFKLLAGNPYGLLGYRFLASFVALLIPTTLMGGTYPVVLKYLTRRVEQLGGFASRLYWLNTAGAILGTCLAGFVLLWHVGLRLSVLVAVTLNLTAAALIGLTSRRLRHPAGIPSPPPESKPSPRLTLDAATGGPAILAVAGLAGFTGMMFEISWTRILVIILSSTTYAFTLMLASFLLGITGGSYLFERWHRQMNLNRKLLGRLLTFLALASLLFIAVGSELAEFTRRLAVAAGESGAFLLACQFLVSLLAMVFPTILFGLVFPLTVVLYCGRGQRAGARSGVLYATNTLGAIVGALAAGLLLVPWLNSVNTSLLASGLLALASTLLFLTARPVRSTGSALVSTGVVLLVAAAALTGLFARPILFRSVVANVSRTEYRGALTVGEIADIEKVTFAEEGVNTTVVVTRGQGHVALQTNGKTEASNGEDQQTQLMGAYLPLSLHPHPRHVLIIGFGSGATVHAATQFSAVERVDCVEIEPAVLRAAPYMDELNHGVVHNPKVHIILDDARNYLSVTDQRYDVIISEPSYLWSAGIASLFTQEFYRQVRERLAPDGLFMQWVQVYQLGLPSLATVARTLGSNFDQVSLWRGSSNDYLLLASPTARQLSLQPLVAEYGRNAELRSFLSRHLFIEDPAGLLGAYLLGDQTVREMARAGDLNTDDRTVLEYRAPYDVLRTTDRLTHALVRSLRREALPEIGRAHV